MKRPDTTPAQRKVSKATASKKNAVKINSAEERERFAKRSRVVRLIRSLPSGKVSTYGAIAKAAGWPGAARQVVRILRQVPGLHWHRVLGSGGAIKLSGENGAEQRFRLQMEKVTFRGVRVNMKLHELKLPKPTGN